MTGQIYEIVIIFVILIGFGVVIWRGGSANPVGTGMLDKRLSHMDSELKGLGGKVDEIDERVEDIDRRAASKNDIRRVEKRLEEQAAKADETAAMVANLRELVSAQNASVDAIGRQVDRLYNVIVNKGMGS